MRSFIAFASLLLVLDDVLLLQLAHALDFIQINDKTLILWVTLLDALTAEYYHVIWAVKVLHTISMLLAKLASKAFFIFLIKIKTSLWQDLVLFNHFVKNVDIERKTLGRLNIFYKLAANRASYAVLVV